VKISLGGRSGPARPGDLAIAQHPAEIGYFGVVTDYAAVPIHIGTGFTVMDANNIDDPEIRKFVYSD
jgi:ribose transport system substrate-binding protein